MSSRWQLAALLAATALLSEAAAQSWSLESLGEPALRQGVPSSQMWRDGNLLYGEAVDPIVGETGGPFFVYDATARRTIYSGDADIHTGFRNIIVDNAGNAYFSANTNGLAKYSPSGNAVTVLPVTLPGELRASTRQASDGWIYGATDQPTLKLFRFHPQSNAVVVIGDAWGYTAHMVLDPTERFIYYIADAHGNAWQKGTPLLQFDVQSRTHKVIAFLNNVIEPQFGYRLGGTYALDIDPEGRRIFINMNASRVGVDSSNGFGSPAVVVVHIPSSEAEPVAVPQLRFFDVAPKLGIVALLTNSYIHSSSWGDVDNDGRVDLFVGTFVSGGGTLSSKLLLNRTGKFVDAAQPAVETRGRAGGSVFADFDNDGDLDLFISNNSKTSGTGPAIEPSRILRNDNGTFTNVTPGSGIQSQSSNGRQVAVLDYNNDGLLDLFIVADKLVGRGPTVLLRNTGNFKFTNATVAAGFPTNIYGLGLALADVNDDGWPDVFVAGGGAHDKNYLFLANGDATYRLSSNNAAFDWTPFVTGNEDWVSSGCFADFNRDGRVDLVVGHHFGTAADRGIGAALRIYMNRGGGTDPVFEDITTSAGMPRIVSKAPHVEIQDFNNDGWPDIYTSIRTDSPFGPQPLIFMHNGLTNGDPVFISPVMTNLNYYPGGPVADFNCDGKLDIFFEEFRTVFGAGYVPPMLMQNVGAPGNWLQVNVDHGSNRNGVGAKIKIYRAGQGGNAAALLGFREISPAFGFSSSQPALAHFGLGNEMAVDVVVEMPFNRLVFTRAAVPANRLFVMPNGSVHPPPHLGLSTNAMTLTSTDFLREPAATLPPHTTATTPPVVDFAPYPKPNYAGKPWSQWGAALFASNGRFYCAIGDHYGLDGNSYVYEYDATSKRLTLVGDTQTAINHIPGSWGHGKIHGQINEGNDGFIYMPTYWGSRRNLVFSGSYKGSVILRYPVRSLIGGAPGPLRINRIRQSNTKATLAFMTATGRTYTVEYGPLRAGTWTALTTLSGDGTERIMSDSNAVGPGRFYRLRVQE